MSYLAFCSLYVCQPQLGASVISQSSYLGVNSRCKQSQRLCVYSSKGGEKRVERGKAKIVSTASNSADKGESLSNKAVANDLGPRQQMPAGQKSAEERVWGQRRLSDMEQEILGSIPKDVLEKSKGRIEIKVRSPKGEDWSVLDELIERGMMMPPSSFEEQQWYKTLVSIGEWLTEKTEKPSASEEKGFLAPELFLIVGGFCLWMFLVLVAARVITLPASLQSLQDLLVN